MSEGTSSKRKASGSGDAAHMSVSSAATGKRTRFDVAQAREDEDTQGDLDIEEQDRKRNQQGRRGRVVTDGYDSDEGDSEDLGLDEEDEDEEELTGRSNVKSAGADEDEDQDMFALDGERGNEEKAKKKYLDLNDIEGQEFSDKASDEEEKDAELELESDDDDDDHEEQNTQNGPRHQPHQQHDPEAIVQPLKRRKKQKPERGDTQDMGYEIDSFNMKNEMATGRFDEQGNYIPNAKDPHAEHDLWLQGSYSRKSIQAAKEAKQRREQDARRREATRQHAEYDEDECKKLLVTLMKRKETVLVALQRIGSDAKRLRKKNSKEAASSTDVERVKQELDQITSLSSELMSRYGRVNIYDATYESLLGDVRKSGLVRGNWDPAAAAEQQTVHDAAHEESHMYEYKWSPAYLKAMSNAAGTETESGQSSEQRFGPFSEQDMRAWMQAGYFGESGERILVRLNAHDRQDGGDWQQWQDALA